MNIKEIEEALKRYDTIMGFDRKVYTERELNEAANQHILKSPTWLRELLTAVKEKDEQINSLQVERDYFERVSNQHYDKWRSAIQLIDNGVK